MPRTGRPKKEPDQKLDARIELRVTASEKAEFEKAASNGDVPLSEWIRAAAKRVLKGESRA